MAKLAEVDADKDGAVTEAEFCVAVPALDVGISADEAKAVFSLLDIMGDGKLKADELLMALNVDVAGASTPGAVPDVLAAKQADAAPVGTPSSEERSMKLVQEALAAKGAGLVAALREMDRNNDGVITSREFCRAVNRLQGVDVTQEDASALFQHLLASRPADASKPQTTSLTIDETVALFAPAAAADARRATEPFTAAGPGTAAQTGAGTASAASASTAGTIRAPETSEAQHGAASAATAPGTAGASATPAPGGLVGPGAAPLPSEASEVAAPNPPGEVVGGASSAAPASAAASAGKEQEHVQGQEQPPASDKAQLPGSVGGTAVKEGGLGAGDSGKGQGGAEAEGAAADSMSTSVGELVKTVQQAMRQRRTTIAATFKAHAESDLETSCITAAQFFAAMRQLDSGLSAAQLSALFKSLCGPGATRLTLSAIFGGLVDRPRPRREELPWMMQCQAPVQLLAARHVLKMLGGAAGCDSAKQGVFGVKDELGKQVVAGLAAVMKRPVGLTAAASECCLVATEALGQLVYEHPDNALLVVQTPGIMPRAQTLLSSSALVAGVSIARAAARLIW